MGVDLAAPKTTPVGSVSGRAIWILVDQAANSLFSLAAGITAAQLLSVAEFGLFAVLFAAYLAVRDLVRAVAVEPVIIDHAGTDSWEQRPELVTITAVAGVVFGVVGAGFVLAARADLALAVVVAVGLTPLLLADSLRGVAIAQGRPREAARVSVGLVVAFAFLLVLSWRSSPGLGALAAVTAASGAAGVGLVARWLCRPASLEAARVWLVNHRATSGPLSIDYLVSTAVTYGIVFVLAVRSLSESAALRGAQMVAAPMFLLFVAAMQFVVAEDARVHNQTGERSMRLASRALGFMVAVGVVYWLAVRVFEPLVVRALGESGTVVQPVLMPMMFFALTTAPGLAASAALRAWGMARSALIARLITTVLVVPAIGVGALVGGAATSMLFGALAQLITSPVFGWYVWRATNGRDRPVATNHSAGVG